MTLIHLPIQLSIGCSTKNVLRASHFEVKPAICADVACVDQRAMNASDSHAKNLEENRATDIAIRPVFVR